MGILDLVAHRVFKIRSELEEIYLNQVIQTFALSLIGIFIPIYLITLGFSFHQAMLYIMVELVVMGMFSPFAGRIAASLGLKHTILYRAPLVVFYFLLLIILGFFSMPIEAFLLIGALNGLSGALYWNSLNAEFVRNSDDIHGGEETAHLVAFPKLATIIAPIIGAIILDLYGFDPLFVFVILLMVLSVAPLFATLDRRKEFKFRLSDLRNTIPKKYLPKFFTRGWTYLIEIYVWPVWIYLTFGDVFWAGVAAAITGVGVSVFTLFVGKISDRFDKRKMLRMGAALYALVWFMRSFASVLPEVFLLSFLGGMSMALITVPLFSSFCNEVRRGNILSSVVQREMGLTVGRFFCLLVVLTLPFNYIFGIAGFVALLFLL